MSFRCVWSRPVEQKKKKLVPERLVETSVIKSFTVKDGTVNAVTIPDDVQAYLSRYLHYLFRVLE
jgi:hypothetical protein